MDELQRSPNFLQVKTFRDKGGGAIQCHALRLVSDILQCSIHILARSLLPGLTQASLILHGAVLFSRINGSPMVKDLDKWYSRSTPRGERLQGRKRCKA